MAAEIDPSCGELSQEKIQDLIQTCVRAKAQAYAPYSNFKVGAALLTKEGKVFHGCNVENSAYPLCTCAERTAIVKAVSEGHREFTAMAVATDSPDVFASPCGSCRQTMAEFGSDYTVILTKPDGSYKTLLVRDLLPHGFTDEHLRAGQDRS